MGLVVLLVRPRASLGDVAGLQPAGDVVIDELAPAVRIENRHREWEPLLALLDALEDPLGRVVADRGVLGPAGHQISHRQGAGELAD